MSNNLIIECEYCGDSYCGECSHHDSWREYCSVECEEKAKKDN